MIEAPFLLGVRRIDGKEECDANRFPFNLPFVRELALEFRAAVTFLVGENGSGKSTLIEAIAALCGLPVSGGSRNELAERHGPDTRSELSEVLRPTFRSKPRDGFFVRAEFQAHLASLLDQRAADADFPGNPYQYYGGQSLHTRSHGEAFLALVENRIRSGLILMDEPESALSPQRQLHLLAQMVRLVAAGNSQFIVATHSPILLTYPEADIISFDEGPLHSIALEETSHYQITRGILDCPERYWRYLNESGG